MHAFLMGRRDRRLFAAYDPPLAGAGPERAAVLCNPWGKEYLNAHRALRQLALQLAASGCHALRFDWYGCGDSHGDAAAGDVPGWRRDIGAAVEELQAISGVQRVHLVGLRLGAALAFEASLQRHDIAGVALWDPVVDGEAYLRELIDMDGGNSAAGSEECAMDNAAIGLLGFTLTASQRRDIEAISLEASEATVGDLLLLMSEERSEYEAFQEGLSSAHEVAVEVGPQAWVEQPEVWAGAIPVTQLERIVQWLTRV